MIHYSLRPLLGSLERDIDYGGKEAFYLSQQNERFYALVMEALEFAMPLEEDALDRL